MSGDSTIPLIARAEEYQERTAIIASEGVFTYRDLLHSSGRVASRLLEGADDLWETRVAFLVPPGFDYVTTQWGIWRAGGIAVPLSMRDRERELRYMVNDLDAAIVIARPDAESATVLRRLAGERRARFLLTTELPDAPDRMLPKVEVTRKAMILYTSGTTGAPKGVVSTHSQVQAQVTSLVSAWEWSPDDHILNALPLHHVHGIINALTCALWVGATCEILPRFDAEQVWSRLSKGDLTLCMGVPTIYMALIRAWDEASPQQQRAMSEGCSRLRLMVSGSAPLPVSTFERWKTITGQVLLERYGMTEIGMALSNPLRGQRIPATVGGPLLGVEVRLVELDRGHLLETGERRYGRVIRPDEHGQAQAQAPLILEIQVRGPSVFREYWRKPEATEEAFNAEGWFCTGDAGSVKDGRYCIEGRVTQDIVISGGENVSAIAVQNYLVEHPEIAECAVVGIKDPFWGEALSAAIVLRQGSNLASLDDGSFRQVIREWSKKRVADHKVPWNVVRCDELPRNAMGKVVKPRVVTLIEASITGCAASQIASG